MKYLGKCTNNADKKTLLARKSVFCLCTFAAALCIGCDESNKIEDDPTVTPGDNPGDGPEVTPGDNNPGGVTPGEKNEDDKDFVFSLYQTRDPVERTFEMNARIGCALDSDCQTGTFCFHGSCTSECSDTNPCAQGTCTQNGRCLTIKPNILRTLNDDLTEAKNSDVVERIPGAEVLFKPDDKVFVEPGADFAFVSLVTMQDYNTISYTVANPMEDTVSGLKQTTATVDTKSGQATYMFAIPAKESSLGDQGSTERIILDTSVGSYEIALVPRKPSTGLYEGSVSADQFSGVSLPIRMIIETQPAQIASFKDITNMTIYLPVSGDDLFSPENVGDKTKWSKVVMKKETTNCMDSDLCWSANYSTNDYTFPESQLLDASQKVNRAIRIEMNGYDENSMIFDGSIRDMIAGVYRQADTNGNMQWAEATMDGTITVTRKGAFDPNDAEYKNSIVTHSPQNKNNGLRPLTSNAANVCNNDDIRTLMANAGSSCSSITTLNAYNSAQNKVTCLLAATDKILESPNMVSKIIEGLIKKEANNTQPVQGFNDLQEFMDNCALDNGICQEHHEYICGVDLLGRAYLTSTDNNKQKMLENWHQLLRESYLGRQYSAWQNDVAVRRQWLESAAAPGFLKSSVVENTNKQMLAEWESKVFDAHLYVLKQQFNQTSLEVLTRVDNSNDIASSRDLILAEFADGWNGVSDSMALGLRRYDTLLQSTSQRTSKAADMRPHLFDLYYSGLVETAINRDTGNGSLNGSYGKNLYENVARLKSLDQSFDDLVFMRDAEVVTSTSLDPQSGNPQVLSDRKALAKDTLAAAKTESQRVFDNYDNKLINKTQINNTLSNTIDSLRSELVNICGMPRGCSNPKDANCMPRVIPLFCGFDLPADSNVPGDLSKTFDTDISKEEINNYYSAETYKITDDDIDRLMLTASDIKNMDQNQRDTLLGIKAEDYKNKDGSNLSQNEIDALVDERVTQYLTNLKSLKQITLTDYYSMVNESEAADAILAYRSAQKDVDIAKAEFTALSNKVAIARSTCEAYAVNIENWNDEREKLLKEVQANINKINEHYDNITEAERKKIEDELKSLENQYAKQSKNVADWKTLAETHVTDQKDYISTIQHLTNASLSLDYAAAVAERGIESLVAYAEDPVDSDRILGIMSANGLYKGAVTSAGNIIVDCIDGANLGLNIAINNNQAYMDIDNVDYDYNVEVNDRDTELAISKLELDLQKSFAKWKKYDDEQSCKDASETLCHSIVSCECPEEVGDIYSEVSCPEDKGCKLDTQWYVQGLDQWILSEQNAIDTLDEVNDTLRELFDIRNAYERDLQDLEFKRTEYMQMAQDLLVKREQILQAQIKEYTALKHYYTVVQRAMMLESQYKAAQERFQILNNLYTTPAAIFSFASDLETVESKIELAKERIYDYLAAVEYLAVRPFVDMRRATYLARSINDLDKIIDQVDTIVNSCGAPAENRNTVEISVREMMGITQDFASMTMGERFQSVIAKGNIPINSLTRYTAEKTVRDLVNKNIDLRSGTFAVTIDKSMNLATTCNAKIDSIAVKIVGDENNIIKAGAGKNVSPTITVFYDGQTQLVSCQPNISTLVKTIGSKTSYGTYSTFIVEPQKVSPTAKINEYGSPNYTLAGKPFATSYTVLIDTQVSENGKIDWNKVEDIMLQVTYTYQDIFQNSHPCVSL